MNITGGGQVDVNVRADAILSDRIILGRLDIGSLHISLPIQRVAIAVVRFQAEKEFDGAVTLRVGRQKVLASYHEVHGVADGWTFEIWILASLRLHQARAESQIV